LTTIQAGLWERLLSDEGEQLLSREYETPIFQTWLGDGPNAVPETTTPGTMTKVAIDYRQFKLFHLSILWRATVSTLDAFSNVVLEPDHRERLREMLAHGDPGGVFDYPFLVKVLCDDQGAVDRGLISQPQRSEFAGRDVYYVAFGGYEVTYFVSRGRDGLEALEGAFPEPGGAVTVASVHLSKANSVRTFVDDAVAHAGGMSLGDEVRQRHERDDET